MRDTLFATVQKIRVKDGVTTVTAKGTTWPATNVYVWTDPRDTKHITAKGQKVPIHQVGSYYYPVAP